MNKNKPDNLDLKLGRNVIIHEGGKIGKNVTIADNCIIYPNVIIGDNVNIGPFCTIGEPTGQYYKDPDNYSYAETKIGSNSIIRSYSIIYCGVVISNNCQTGHRVTIREETIIGHNTKIGTLSDIQGKCTIGNYTSIHSNVHICQGSVVKDYVWLYPYVVLTNDKTPPSFSVDAPVIEDFAVIATGSVILPGVNVGKDALVGASSLIKKNVPAEMLVAGNPAKEYFSVKKIKNKDAQSAYPWRYNFDRGMPWEKIGFDQWLNNKNS